MTRQEHMQWCKDRALEYITKGNFQEAYASMLSDLGKHPETAHSQKVCVMLGMVEMMNPSVDSMKKFIEGFN